jgi:23S rRNA (cytidine1920-2'-O)/16S rRNA (cytidine1409-2'-O)-methyltransferase
MSKPMRLDAELVRRGMSRSRADAKRAIEEGRVQVGGIPVQQASSLVTPDASIAFATDGPRFVSRGGNKLDGALDRLEVAIAGRRWLDAGSSTGGFTDRLLQGGAAAVVAVDVGYGQLDWSLRNDDRVAVMERVNVRTLRREHLPWAPDGVVADLSFISLSLVLPTLVSVAADSADYVLLVKPQFEVGKALVGKGGVVRDPDSWTLALNKVVDEAERLGLGLVGAVPSEVPGPAGNREFFVHLRAGAIPDRGTIRTAVEEVSG